MIHLQPPQAHLSPLTHPVSTLPTYSTFVLICTPCQFSASINGFNT